MAIIVEDGTGLAAANSYASVEEANGYHIDRNNTAWAAAEAVEREAALINATMYLDGTYKWDGTRCYAAQALGWPRVLMWDADLKAVASNAVPAKVKAATCELALAALSGALAPALDRGGKVTSESIGPISVSYASGAPGGKVYPIIDYLVRDLIIAKTLGGGVSMGVSRG